jgi:hypothetical protein
MDEIVVWSKEWIPVISIFAICVNILYQFALREPGKWKLIFLGIALLIGPVLGVFFAREVLVGHAPIIIITGIAFAFLMQSSSSLKHGDRNFKIYARIVFVLSIMLLLFAQILWIAVDHCVWTTWVLLGFIDTVPWILLLWARLLSWVKAILGIVVGTLRRLWWCGKEYIQRGR